MKKLILALALAAITAAGSAQAAELAVTDISLTPDGTTATQELQTDVATPNGGSVLPSNTVNDVYTITTYNFGTGSDAHFISKFQLSGGQPRLGIEVNDDGLIQFVSTGDTTRTNVNLATDLAGTSVTVLMKQNYDPGNNLTYGYANSGQDTLMNVWVDPTFSSVEGSGLSAGDMFTLWDSKSYTFYTHTIQNQSTPGTAGDSTITDTVILTGADATYPRALEYAVDGGPTSPGTVSAYISTVSASPLLVADDNATPSTITVTLTDSAGDPVASKEVSLASDGDAGITTSNNISDVNGVVIFEVTSGTTGVQEFTATDVTDSNLVLYQTASVTFETPGTIDPDISTVMASLPDVPADGSTTSTITVTLQNSIGNPVENKDVLLTSDGDASISPSIATSTDVNGQVSFQVSTTTQGTQIFTATDVTNNPPPASVPVTQTAAVVFTEVSPTSAVLFHEPFDFADGSDLDGQGDWSAGTNTGGAFVEVLDGTGAEPWNGVFTGVTQIGNYVGRSQSPLADWVYGGNALDPSVTATFTDGAVTWLSFIQYGNNAQVAIGADVLQERGQKAAGQNIGAGGIFNNSSVRAHYWDDEDENGSYEDIPSVTTIGNSNPHFVIARIVWSDTGQDTITCARFTSGSTISEAEFNAASQSTISADLDQSVFDTVSFAGSQYYIDEIRIATTFDGAVNGTISSNSDFDTWAGDYPGLGAAGEDDDGDGWTNDEERIFGLNPTDGASANPISTPFDAGTFSYTRRTQSLTGLTYTVWYSTDLAQWFEDTGAVQTPGTPANDVELVGVAITPALLDEPKLFIQLRAAAPVPPAPAPELSSLWGSNTSITLNFTEAMDETSATDTANYSVDLDGGGTVTVDSALLSSNGRTVTLSLGSALGIDSAYNVAMSNLTGSGSGEPLSGSGTAQFLTWDNDLTGVKVFILAGQSNMVGYGKTEWGGNPDWTDGGTEPKEILGGIGCLRWLAKNNASFPQYDYTSLLEDSGDLDSAWKTRPDVKVWWHNGASSFLGGPLQKGDLGPPFQGSGSTWFGPEFGFGQIIGDYYGSNDVLIIKTAWGGRSLGVDFRPPSAVAARGGEVGLFYNAIFDEVREVLSNLHTEFPEWGPSGANLGYQIVGFGWHQGYNDRVSGPLSDEYDENLPDLISDVRAEFGIPDLPFVIATTGMGDAGPVETTPYSGYTAVEKAQLWVAGVDKPLHVLSHDTRPYWRDKTIAPSTQGHHWNHSAESYFLIGKAMGENMVDLLTAP